MPLTTTRLALAAAAAALLALASGIGPDAGGHDATDCRAACTFGTVALRNH